MCPCFFSSRLNSSSQPAELRYWVPELSSQAKLAIACIMVAIATIVFLVIAGVVFHTSARPAFGCLVFDIGKDVEPGGESLCVAVAEGVPEVPDNAVEHVVVSRHEGILLSSELAVKLGEHRGPPRGPYALLALAHIHATLGMRMVRTFHVELYPSSVTRVESQGWMRKFTLPAWLSM